MEIKEVVEMLLDAAAKKESDEIPDEIIAHIKVKNLFRFRQIGGNKKLKTSFIKWAETKFQEYNWVFYNYLITTHTYRLLDEDNRPRTGNAINFLVEGFEEHQSLIKRSQDAKRRLLQKETQQKETAQAEAKASEKKPSKGFLLFLATVIKFFRERVGPFLGFLWQFGITKIIVAILAIVFLIFGAVAYKNAPTDAVVFDHNGNEAAAAYLDSEMKEHAGNIPNGAVVKVLKEIEQTTTTPGKVLIEYTYISNEESLLISIFGPKEETIELWMYRADVLDYEP